MLNCQFNIDINQFIIERVKAPEMQREFSRKQSEKDRARDDSSQRHQRKKKKKHREERYERSRSSSESPHKKKSKRERSNSRSRNKKHRERDRSYERNKSYDHRDHDRDRDRHRDRERDHDRGGYGRDRDREQRYDRDRDRGRREYGQRGGRRDRRQPVQKDPYFQKRRQIQRVRLQDPERAEQMHNQLEKQIILDQKQREYEQMKEKFKQAQKQMQQAKREDHTIIVYCLPLKAKQKHIWKFFSQANCGKIRDIRIIKDARSGRSKGVAYVEFYTSDSVQKALTMSEMPFELKGRKFTSLKVQHSQAEKNRAAAAAKQMKVVRPVDPIEQQQETQKREMKVYVGGLTDKLAEIQESDLKSLFEPFGPIQYVDIHRDPMTGKCKGYAFIQYERTTDAKDAVREMNDIQVGGQRITVQTVSTTQRAGSAVTAGDDYLYSAGSKQSLVNKLSQNAPTHSNLSRPPMSTMSTPYLLLANLFKMQGTTPKFFQDLKKEVMTQCSNYGIVEKCFVEKNNQGNVWVKFSDTQSAVKAQQNLNGKFFDKVKIFCYFVTENTYQTRVGI